MMQRQLLCHCHICQVNESLLAVHILMCIATTTGATIGSLAGAALIAAVAVAASRQMRKKPDSPETMATFNQAYNSNA